MDSVTRFFYPFWLDHHIWTGALMNTWQKQFREIFLFSEYWILYVCVMCIHMCIHMYNVYVYAEYFRNKCVFASQSKFVQNLTDFKGTIRRKKVFGWIFIIFIVLTYKIRGKQKLKYYFIIVLASSLITRTYLENLFAKWKNLVTLV